MSSHILNPLMIYLISWSQKLYRLNKIFSLKWGLYHIENKVWQRIILKHTLKFYWYYLGTHCEKCCWIRMRHKHLNWPEIINKSLFHKKIWLCIFFTMLFTLMCLKVTLNCNHYHQRVKQYKWPEILSWHDKIKLTFKFQLSSIRDINYNDSALFIILSVLIIRNNEMKSISVFVQKWEWPGFTSNIEMISGKKNYFSYVNNHP